MCVLFIYLYIYVFIPETDEVDVKPTLFVCEILSVFTIKSLVANHKTANFDKEVENNWYPVTIAVILCA